VTKRAIDLSRIYVLPDLTADILRRATPAERIAAGMELQRNLRNRLAAAIVSANPEWTEKEIRAEVARRVLAGEYDADQ
jgi:hypothetical protein